MISDASVAPRAGATSLWNARQRFVLAVLLALGTAALLAGYFGTSGTLQVSRQVVWVNVAGAGLLVSGVGVLLFLTAARRQIGRRRLSLFGDVASAGQALVLDSASGGDVAAPDLVSAATMTRYHRVDCPFVAGKPGLVAATAVAHEESGKRPCGVCLPGTDS